MSDPSGNSSLGESWATWSAEDAEHFETDEDLLSGSDLPSPGLSTGPKLGSQDSGSPPVRTRPIDMSDESISGPELIMPSIHEDYKSDGSWIVHPLSTHEGESTIPPSSKGDATSPSNVKLMASEPQETKEKRLSPSHNRTLSQCAVGPRKFSPKYIFIGVFLGLISYFIRGWFIRPQYRPSTSFKTHPGADGTDSELAPYHLMLQKYSVFAKRSTDNLDPITKSTALLRRSDDTITSLCQILIDRSVGPKHELEFECQAAVRAAREGVKHSDALIHHIDVVVDPELTACVQRAEKLLAYSTRSSDSEGLFHRLLHNYLTTVSALWTSKSTNDLLNEQFERCSDTFRHLTHSQIDHTNAILADLDQSQSNLESVERIISLAPSQDNCGVKLRPADTTNPFVIVSRKLKRAVEQYLIDPFIQPPQCVYGLSNEIKYCVFGKLRDGIDLQKEARVLLDGFMSDLKFILWDLDTGSSDI